jgi:predicted secreted protein
MTKKAVRLCPSEQPFSICSLFLDQYPCLQPPLVLRAADAATEQETIEIAVTRVLLKSYYDIVRKNIQDQVPKAIMHFLVRDSPTCRVFVLSCIDWCHNSAR